VGLLIDIVGMGRDARAAALGRCCLRWGVGASLRPEVSVVTALVDWAWFVFGRVGFGQDGGPVRFPARAGEMTGITGIKHESLILAQNERWRHA
jgi:hypothetical protein